MGNWIRIRRLLLTWLLLAILPAVVYHRVYLTSGPHSTYFCGDTVGAYWPDLVFFFRSIVHGELPLWNPDDRGGFPFAYDPQPGVLYPLNWAFVGVATLIGRMPFTLFQFKILLHLSITLLGWFAWLSRRFSKPSSSVGAVGASLGCFTLQNVHFSLIWPIAWVPWFLVALERFAENRRLSWALAAAACVGAIVSAGSPPGAFYGLIVGAALGLPQLALVLWKLPGPARFRLCLIGFWGLLATVALCVPVMLGAARLTSQSVLAIRDFGYVDFGHISVRDLLGFIVPSAAGSYAGVSIAALAAIGICCRFRRPLTLAVITLGALGVLLALGDNTPLLAWASRAFPPVNFFRLPFRYLYLTQIALGILASVGAEELLAPRWRGKRARIFLGSLATGVVLVLIATRLNVLTIEPRMAEDVSMAAFWIALVWIAGALGSRGHYFKWIAAALSLIAVADYAAFVPRTNVTMPGRFEAPQPISESALKTIRSQSDQYRVWDEFAFAYRMGSRLGIRDLRGYMDPLRLAHYDTMVSRLSRSPEMLERWGVRWFLTGNVPPLGPGHHRADVSRIPGALRRERQVFELPRPRPPAFFTVRVASLNTDADEWNALQRDPLGAPLQLPRGIPGARRLPSQGSDRDATLLERSNNSLSFRVESDSAGWFVVNEAFFPGWAARIDGKTAPIYRVDGWIRGIQVGPGVHHIEMSFRPIDWLVTASLAVVLWLCLGGAVIVSGAKRLTRAEWHGPT